MCMYFSPGCMTEAGDACPRCELGQLEVDDLEGFLLCSQCGYVEEEYALVNQSTYDAENGPPGVLVGPEDDGTAAAGALTGHRAGLRSSRADGSSRYLRSALSKLQALGSTLRVSGRHAEEATHVFKQAYHSREWQLQGVPQGTDTLCAACLMLVARAAQLPLTFKDVASAAQVPAPNVASFYKRLCAQASQAADGELLQGGHAPPRPSHSLRALCIRHAALLLQRAIPGQPGSSNTQGVQQGQPPAEQPVQQTSEVDLRSHPFMKTALDVCDLVSKAGICEGRPPPIVAGAVLLFLGEGQQGLHGVVGLTAAELAPQVGCNRAALSSAKDLLTEQLLKLAALLPLGTFITAANMRSYLPLIITNTHVIVSLKRCRTDATAPTPAVTTTITNTAPPGAGGGGGPAITIAPGDAGGSACGAGEPQHTDVQGGGEPQHTDVRGGGEARDGSGRKGTKRKGSDVAVKQAGNRQKGRGKL